MIIETIVTTIGSDTTLNCAPMGVEWADDVIVLKPFVETATFRNLVAQRSAVVNLTDDVRLFARAAIASPTYPTVAAIVIQGAVLTDACAWREVRVRAVDDSPPRARIEADVVHRGVFREFIGFCRAQHAVLEAAIYATRLHLHARSFVDQELSRLQVIVDKTGGPRELEAMALIVEFVQERSRPGAAGQ